MGAPVVPRRAAVGRDHTSHLLPVMLDVLVMAKLLTMPRAAAAVSAGPAPRGLPIAQWFDAMKMRGHMQTQPVGR